MTFPHLRGKQPWMFTCSRYLPFSLWRHHRKCLWMHFILHSNKVHFSFFFTKEESKVFSDFCHIAGKQLAGCRELFPSHVYWCICSEVSCFIHKVAQRKETMEVQGYCGTWCLYTVSLNCYLFNEMTECFCSEHTYRGDIDLSDLGWPDVWTSFYLTVVPIILQVNSFVVMAFLITFLAMLVCKHASLFFYSFQTMYPDDFADSFMFLLAQSAGWHCWLLLNDCCEICYRQSCSPED